MGNGVKAVQAARAVKAVKAARPVGAARAVTGLATDAGRAGRARAGAGGRRASRLLAGVTAAFGLLLGLGLPQAQAQNAKLRMERFAFDSLPDIKLYLTYVEEDGTVIAGRAATDFKLQLDAADQGPAKAVATFDQLKEPIFVVGVAQVSGVVQERWLAEIKAGFRKINEAVASTPGGRMGVLAYAGDTKRLIESGTSSEVDGALSKLAIDAEASETHMIDAVRTAIDLLKAQEKGRRKLIVVFSDGINVNNDKKGFVDLGNRAQQAGIVIDTVGYNEFDPPKLRNLQEMAKRCYGIDRVAKSVTDLGPRFDAVVDEIQKQYVATFPLSIAGDDKEHTFQVTHEAGGKPVYSNAVNEKLPSQPTGPAPVKVVEQPRRWWWLLIPAGVVAAIVLYLLLRKKAPPPAPEQPKLQAPSLTPQLRPGSKTVALDAAGEVAMGWIMGLTGKYKDVTFKLKDRAVIGTASDCDVVIEDGFMSGRHCEIRKIEGGYKLVDLGATNGVIVNDKRVKEHFLVDNDNFRLGRTEFKFKSIFS